MDHRRNTIPCSLLVSMFVHLWVGVSTSAAQVLEVPNVVNQFNEWSFRADPMGFWCVPPLSPGYSFAANHENHWQGIARHPDPNVPVLYMIGSRDSCTKLSIVKIGSADILSGSRLRSNRLWYSTASYNTPPTTGDRIVGEIDILDTHGGGMQIAGHYLAIPSGNRCDGQINRIMFYDISNPLAPSLSSYISTGSKGIVGFTQLDDGKYLIVATGGDNTSLDFYTLDTDLSLLTRSNWDPNNPEHPLVGQPWPECNQLNYCMQSLQLVNPSGEPSNVVYMIGFQQTSISAPLVTGLNLAWLFKITLTDGSAEVQTVAIRQLNTSTVDGTGFDNGNFSAAAGLYVSPTGEMIAYTTEHYINYNNAPALDNVVVMSEFASRRGVSPASAPAGGCIAHVELATGTNFGGRILKADALDEFYENFAALSQIDGGFANNVSSLTWTLPVGCTCRLYAGANYTGNYLDLVGDGGSGEISSLASVGWSNGAPGSPANNIQSLRFLGDRPSPTIPGDPSIALPLIAANIAAGPCAMVKFRAGNFPGPAIFDRQCILRNVDLGDARIGGSAP